MNHHLPALLKARLKSPPPGQAAQYRMAPFHRSNEKVEGIDSRGYRSSAVLILLCSRANTSWFVPLTLRAEYAGAHSAQISLPGGKFDDNDGTLERTALRECYEEIGIRDHIEVLGPLSELLIPVSRYRVQPFVAVCSTPVIEYRSHEREVKALIELPLDVLLDDKNVRSGPVAKYGDQRITAPYYDYDTHRIWGATAMILSELKETIKEIL